MVEGRPILTGPWLSRYEYGEGKVGQHVVDLRQYGLKVVGASRLDPTGSEVFLHLRLLGNTVLGGEWKEITSRRGEYGGQEFQGWVGFVLDDEATRAEGIWIGPNRDNTKINSGRWTLDKQTDDSS